jgi:Domain of unknown function (DUF4190)
VSDAPQGPGWWLASDGRWYSPDQSPGPAPEFLPPEPAFTPGDVGPPAAVTGAGAPATAPAFGPPPFAPTYGPPPAAPGYGYPYPYPSAYPPYPFAPAQKTNGLAVASFVCSFFFWIYGLGSVLAIVFGFIARSQIKRSEGAQKGRGLALAGIIIGITTLLISAVIVVVAIVVIQRHCHDTGNCTFHTNFNTTN